MNTDRTTARSLLLGLGAGALALGAFPSPAPFAAAPLAAQASAAELDRVVGALRGISTMQADFTQTDRQGRMVSGAMTLKRPGKIRFDYGKNSDFLVVSNGKSLYVVDYEVGQVERWPISNSPLGALFDPDRDVKRFGKLIPTGNPQVVSVEVRDPAKPEFGVITLIFVRKAGAPGGLELSHWVALDAQSHRTTVRLANHRYGMNIAESTFKFRDPRRTTRRPS